MRIDIHQIGDATVVALEGELDASTAPTVQERVLPLVKPGCRMLLDMSAVPYMSSAGLRLLLSTYRQVAASGGRIALVGLADEIRDTMAITGFLGFFKACATVDEGVNAVAH